MGKRFTVKKEADYRWNVMREDGSKLTGPFRLKRDAFAYAEAFNRTPENPDAGVGAHSSNTISANNNPKNAALPPASAVKQTKKATVAAASTSEPAPPQLRCACGWIVIPAVAYQHFEDCPAIGVHK
jgi:hypothetical protein